MLSETPICTACGIAKPLDEFGSFRRRGRVERHRECKPCKRARDRAAYADQPKRREQISANREKHAAASEAALRALRSILTCSDCGVSDDEARLLLHRPDGRNISDMAREAYSVKRVIIDAMNTMPLCRSCSARRQMTGAQKRHAG